RPHRRRDPGRSRRPAALPHQGAVRDGEWHGPAAGELRANESSPLESRRQPPANRIIHFIALTQTSRDPSGRTYYLRKQAEGRTKKDALRCLKRWISDR